MNAWLLTWEGTTGPARSEDDKIVAILSGRLSPGSIELVVDALYTRCIWMAESHVLNAHKRKGRDAQFRHTASQPDRIFYGANPCIFARIVTNLRVETDDERQVEHVAWTERAYLRIKEPGGMPVEVEPALEKRLTRKLKPLAPDIFPR
jgi:hypothetical protein